MPAPVNTIAPNISAGVGNIGTTGGAGVDTISWSAGIKNIQGKKFLVTFNVLQLGTNATVTAGQSSAPAQDYTYTPTLGFNSFTFTVGHVNAPLLTFAYTTSTNKQTVVSNFQVTDATQTSGDASYRLSTTVGIYTVQPQIVKLVDKVALTVSFHITTSAAILSPARRFSVVSTNFAIQTFNAAFKVLMPPTVGVYSITAQSASTKVLRGVQLFNSYAINGPNVSFNIGHKLSAFVQTYTTAGNAVTDLNHRLLANCVSVLVTTSETSSAIGGNHIIVSVPTATYSITGFNANLTHYHLTADQISFAVRGSASMLLGHRIAAATTSYAVTATAQIYKTARLAVESSIFSVLLRPITAVRALTRTSDVQFYSISAPSVDFSTRSSINFLTENYSLMTFPAVLQRTKGIMPQATTYKINGVAVLTASRFLYPTEQIFTYTPVGSSISFGRGVGTLGSVTVSYNIFAKPITMLRGKGFFADTFIYTIDPAVALIYGPSPPSPPQSNRRIKLKAQNRTVVIPITQ